MLKMMSGFPVDISTPDLSHLTEEEKRIIENVIHRQKMEEEKENVLKSPPASAKMPFDKTPRGQAIPSGGERGKGRGSMIVSIAEIGKQKQSPDTGAFCDVCKKTKFADGAGHVCCYCRKRSCARCGAKMALKPGSSQAIWVCLGCRKKHQSVTKTGDWLEQKVTSPPSPPQGKDEMPLPPTKEGGYAFAPTLRIIAPSGSTTDMGHALSSPRPRRSDNDDEDTGRFLTPPSSGLSTNHHIQRSASGSFKKSHQQLCLAKKASSTTTSPKNTPDGDKNLLTAGAIRHRHGVDDVIDDVDAVSSETLCPPHNNDEDGGGRYLFFTPTTQPPLPLNPRARPLFYYYSSEDVGCYSQDEPQGPPIKAPSTNQNATKAAVGGGGIPFARNDSLSSDQSESLWGGAQTISSSAVGGAGMGQRRRPPPPRARRLRPRTLPSTVGGGGEEEDFKSTPFSSCGEEEEKGGESESVLSFSEKEQSRVDSRNNVVEFPESSFESNIHANQNAFVPCPATRERESALRDEHRVTWTPSEDGDWLIGRMTLHKPTVPPFIPSPSEDGSVWGEAKAPPTSLLGLKIVGGRDVGRGRIEAVVGKVKKGSVADTIARLQPGDEIMDWNGMPLSGLAYDEVAAIISRSRTLPHLRLTVRRPIRTLVFSDKTFHHGTHAPSDSSVNHSDFTSRALPSPLGMTLRIQLIPDSAGDYTGIRVLSADHFKMATTAYVETHILTRTTTPGRVVTQFLGRTPAISNNVGSEICWEISDRNSANIFYVANRDIGAGRAQAQFSLWIMATTGNGRNSDSLYAQCFVDLNAHLAANYGRRPVTLTLPLTPNSSLTADQSGYVRRRSPSDTYLGEAGGDWATQHLDQYYSDREDRGQYVQPWPMPARDEHSLIRRQSFQALPYPTTTFYPPARQPPRALGYDECTNRPSVTSHPTADDEQLIYGRNPADRPTRWMSSGHLETSADRYGSRDHNPNARYDSHPLGRPDVSRSYGRQASYYPMGGKYSLSDYDDPDPRGTDPERSADQWPRPRGTRLDLSTLPPLHHARATYRQLPRLPSNVKPQNNRGQFLDPKDAERDARRHSTNSVAPRAQAHKSLAYRKYSSAQLQDGPHSSPIYSDSELTRHQQTPPQGRQQASAGDTADLRPRADVVHQSESEVRLGEQRGSEVAPPLRKQSIGDKMAALVTFGRRSSSATQLPIDPTPNPGAKVKNEVVGKGPQKKEKMAAGRPTDPNPSRNNNHTPPQSGGGGRRDHVTSASGNALRKAVLLKQASKESYDGACSLPSLSSGSGRSTLTRQSKCCTSST